MDSPTARERRGSPPGGRNAKPSFARGRVAPGSQPCSVLSHAPPKLGFDPHQDAVERRRWDWLVASTVWPSRSLSLCRWMERRSPRGLLLGKLHHLALNFWPEDRLCLRYLKEQAGPESPAPWMFHLGQSRAAKARSLGS